jgi:phosphoenolpyruvate-protein phosphotransferase
MAQTILEGIPASEGIAIGPAHIFRPADWSIPPRDVLPFDDEWHRYLQARRIAHQELGVLREHLARRVGNDEAAILDAHRMMLDDPMWEDKVRQRLRQGSIAEQAVAESAHEIAKVLGAMGDELFASRGADVLDVGYRLVRVMLGRPPSSLAEMRSPAVVVADDLTPSDTAQLDPDLALAICTGKGGKTSHSAILARSLGIPAVVGIGAGLLGAVNERVEMIADGDAGRIVISPEPETLKSYQHAKVRLRRRTEMLREQAQVEARTADGRRVEVAANIGDVASARLAVACGAEGVGLLRTEFIYLESKQPPPEEVQVRTYASIFATMGRRPIIVRTLDVGGDKPPHYLPFPEEANPFLGWRAIRVSLDRPDLFRLQLRAVLRASVGYDVRIMLPMVTGLEELSRTRDMLAEVEEGLQRDGLAHASDIPVGIMVETPAAALLVDILASKADFYSLGTNDLTQYTLAVDRGNPVVAGFFQPLHPAMLRIIRGAIDAAHAAGKWIGMCGELAGSPEAIPILLGMGLDEFSMAPNKIPEAKNLIRRIETPRAETIAAEVMTLTTTEQVHRYMREVLQTMGEG